MTIVSERQITNGQRVLTIRFVGTRFTEKTGHKVWKWIDKAGHTFKQDDRTNLWYSPFHEGAFKSSGAITIGDLFARS